ncbi:DUF421 domain-containing protein, partial [Actinotignum timonense]|nr:DUF421 domain-containing protein [Actinotignum timonense]
YGSISGNYCIDKKPSAVNGILGRGRRHSTTTEEIMMAVRLRGVACVDDVAAVILEPNGQLSVLTGPAAALDPRLLAGVKDAERI